MAKYEGEAIICQHIEYGRAVPSRRRRPSRLGGSRLVGLGSSTCGSSDVESLSCPAVSLEPARGDLVVGLVVGAGGMNSSVRRAARLLAKLR